MNAIRLKLLQDERGQITVWFVALLILMFGVMALALDVGFLFVARRQAQNAADAAALAGAAELPGCGDELPIPPEDLAIFYADENMTATTFSSGYRVDPPTRSTLSSESGSSSYESLQVRVVRDQNYVFARFLGLDSTEVPGVAGAACAPISRGGVCPIYIRAPSPGTAPTYVNSAGNPVAAGTPGAQLAGAYGLRAGRVYILDKFEHDGGRFGVLDELNGDRVSPSSVLNSGCERPGASGSGSQPIMISEGNEVDLASRQQFDSSVRDSMEVLNDLLLDDPLTADLDCNLTIHLTDDDGLFVPRAIDGRPEALHRVVERVQRLTDPRLGAGDPPCGGLSQDGSPVDDIIYPGIQGRFIQVVMINGSDDVVGIARMYVACIEFDDDNRGIDGRACIRNQSDPHNNQELFAVFADFTAPNLLAGSGLSPNLNAFGPKHVVLVR